MPTAASWPRLRAILDAALESERGISVHYDTWEIANIVRKNMYKIRDMQRAQSRKMFPDPEDPGHGISAYDGLTIWLRSSILRRDMTVIFSDGTQADMSNIPEISRKRDENENLFKGRKVTLIAGGTKIENAASFQEAWEILRRDHPCELVIESGYTLEGLDIKPL